MFAGNIVAMIDLIILAVLFFAAAVGLLIHFAGKFSPKATHEHSNHSSGGTGA